MDHIDSYTAVPRFGWTRVLERMLAWLLRRDAAYRQARHAEGLCDHMRRDIGLPPRDEVPKPQHLSNLW
ncbi:MAG: hypothetical protein AAFV27_04480 [Pseudomonadota bacterium]